MNAEEQALHQRDLLSLALAEVLVSFNVVHDVALTGPELLAAAKDITQQRNVRSNDLFTSDHHSFVVSPWNASDTGVKVTQVDDLDEIVLLLRNRGEVLKLCAALLATAMR